ncbi:MAG: glycoside hydrolase family 3 C-terminal domain-containing protein [Cyclobacteriaceae bacterium]
MKIDSLILLIIIGLVSSCHMKPKERESDKDPFILELLEKMTIEEKVGQMTQVTLGILMKEGSTTEIDRAKLRNAIVENHVGSVLNVAAHALSVEQWNILLTEIQDVATKETPHAIPTLYGIDAIHGANYTLESTLFPHNIGMAATRNEELVKQSAKITAMEVRASGIRWNFDPTMGLGRQPLWSRFEETYGEDVYVACQMSKAAIQSYQEDGLKSPTAVAACMKHYLGYSYPQSGKDRTPAYIPETLLREYFLPPFAEAVESGVATAMINSGEINGTPVHGSPYYLKQILREELGFEGLTVSDWEDIKRLHIRHHIASSPKEAVKIAVNAGVDMSMVPVDFSFCKYLIELVKEGAVSEARINEAVYRILKLKLDLGLFENPYPEAEAIKNFGKPEYAEVALEAARESITLLKNNKDVLPISPKSTILLAGPAANNITSLHSSWSYVWQGNRAEYYPETTLSIKEALEQKIGSKRVLCNSVEDFDNPKNYDPAFIKANADKADYIVLALGEKAYAESPGGIHDLAMNENQLVLARAAASTGKPVILLLAEGRPRVISNIEQDMDAILMLYRPGSQGAKATTDVLFGDYNPNGKLPFTYPRNSGDILSYDHKNSETFNEIIVDNYEQNGFNPQWSFGFGLSYTSYKYSGLELNKKTFDKEEVIEVSVTVTNEGKIAGKETIELYSTDLYASLTPSVKRLRRFKKIHLDAGQTKTVKFRLSSNDLSFINSEGDRIVEDGEFKISIGDQTAKFSIQSKNIQ